MPDMAKREAADELRYGIAALSGLRDLLLEAAGNSRTSYELVGPRELAELVDMVECRISRAAKVLGYTF